jgi:hypothetical protein
MEYNFVERVIREQAVIAAARDLLRQIDMIRRTPALPLTVYQKEQEALRTALTELDGCIDLSNLISASDWQSDEYQGGD